MTGYVFVDWKGVEKELGTSMSQAEIVRRSGVSSKTAANAVHGRKMQRDTAFKVLNCTKIPNPERFIIDLDDDRTTPQDAIFPESYGNWKVSEDDFEHRLLRDVPFSIGKTVNQVDQRVGRIKRFNILKFNDEDFKKVKEEVARHPIVCGMLERHPNFPLYYDSQFHGRRSFWLIEKWEDGVTLEEFVKSDNFDKAEVPRIATELAHALNALHNVGVIRRELNPDRILVRDSDQSLVLVDFETATFAYETSSREIPWRRDPYLASEVASHDVDVRADLFSWAQVVIFCLTQKRPQEAYEPKFFTELPVPDLVEQALKNCTAYQRTSRPEGGFDSLLPLLESWRKSTATK